MSAQVTIAQLPSAGSITGSELVPIVQNGQTVQTTTAAIAASPAQTQTFITVNQEPTLSNSRYLTVGAGMSIASSQAQGALPVNLVNAPLSLVTSPAGIQVKTDVNTLASRSIAISGLGLALANGSAISGDPTVSLTGIMSNLAGTTGTGLLAVNGVVVTPITVTGTASQIDVTNGNTAPIIGIASDPVLPGTGGLVVPAGTTGQRGSSTNGNFRYNTTTATFEGYANGAWGAVITGSGVTSIATGTGLTGGPITSTGTIGIADTGVLAATYGSASVVPVVVVNAQGQVTSATNTTIAIPSTQVSGLGTMAIQNANAVAITGGDISNTTGSFTTLAASSTVSGTGFSAYLASPPPIGATAPNTGKFTSVILTSGTIATAPTNSTDIVNKLYADSIASGLNFHESVQYATTTTLAAYTYNNGASGVGATITAVANGALSLGGGSPSATQRVLVKDEISANAPYNGIYTVTSAGSSITPFVLTRATDYDSSGTGTNEINQGDYVLVVLGTLASTAWVQQTALPITVGVTALTFIQFNAPIVYAAGTGLNLSPSTTFNIATTGVAAASYGTASSVPTLGINAQGQVTSASNTTIAITNAQVSGLGTMSTQNANSVTVTGGTINGTTIGATSTTTGAFTTVDATTVTATTGIFGGVFT